MTLRISHACQLRFKCPRLTFCTPIISVYRINKKLQHCTRILNLNHILQLFMNKNNDGLTMTLLTKMIPSPHPPPHFNLCPATTTFQFLKTFLSSIGQQTTTVITAGYPMVAQVFRESSVPMQCPYCHANITTTTTYETGTLTWLICGILILFGYVSMLSYDPVPPNLLISLYDRISGHK